MFNNFIVPQVLLISLILVSIPSKSDTKTNISSKAKLDFGVRRKTDERELLKKISGCFAVDATFSEKEAYVEGYQLIPSQTFKWIELIVLTNKDKSHISFESVKIENQKISRTWAVSWDYEPKSIIVPVGSNAFEYREIKPTNRSWAQRMYYLDFKPMAEGVALFAKNSPKGNLSNEEMNWAAQYNSEKPVRDEKRTDYDLMYTNSEFNFSQDEWSITQINKKVKVGSSVEIPIVLEEAHLKYVRVGDTECATAQKEWNEKRLAWEQIKLAWEDILNSCVRLKFHDRVDNLTISERLSELANTATDIEVSSPSFKAHAFEIITTHMVNCDPKDPKVLGNTK